MQTIYMRVMQLHQAIINLAHTDEGSEQRLLTRNSHRRKINSRRLNLITLKTALIHKHVNKYPRYLANNVCSELTMHGRANTLET